MRAAVVGLLAAFCGCTTSPGTTTTLPVSTVRRTLSDPAAAILQKSLRGEGWDAVVVNASAGGVASADRDETWEESTAWVTFTASRDGGAPELLLPDEAAKVLKRVRTDLEKVVTTADGEVLNASYGEAYRLKWLLLSYKMPGVTGTARVTIGPASDKAEETTNRLEVVVREQAGR